MIEVKRYRKPDGYPSRYWGVYVDGELLAVVLYRKGAIAIADLLMRGRYAVVDPLGESGARRPAHARALPKGGR
jgi:hypothetical protein